MIEVSLIGTGGTVPLPNRWLTSLLVKYKRKSILIDCGEGTQISLKRLGWKPKSVDFILLTHYHGDHVAGLPGILFSIANAQREEPLTIIGPPGLEEIIKGLTVIVPHLPYEIKLIELSDQELTTFEFPDFRIKALPVDHAVSCLAYTIELKRGRKFSPEKAMENKVPKTIWGSLQKGEEITTEGIQYTPDMVLGEERKGIQISYCTDTRPIPELIEFIHQADLFIGEGMYGSEDDFQKALDHKHMLFSEAAQLAKDGEVDELWLTHFSPSLQEPEIYLEKTKKIFENTKLGEDHLKKNIKFKKE